MFRGTALLLALGCLTGIAVERLAGSPAPAVAASPSESVAVERFLADLDKPPVAYEARRRLEASSSKLNESAWMEVITQYDPGVGLTYSIVAEGGSERIRRRVLKSVLEGEQGSSKGAELRKGTLSHENYAFNFGGYAGDGLLKIQLTPRRRDSRLVAGSALLTPTSGDLVKIEGRLSKSPSFWVRWVKISRTYSPIGGAMMAVAVESTADVRFAGMSTFSMTYDYDMVDGQAVNATAPVLAAR